MSKQTAVEWLIEQYENGINTIQVDQIAKLMEKEQIENAYFEGADACDVELEGDRYFFSQTM